MSEESKTVQNLRDFVKTAAKVAVTAPAAAMLLNASVKPANAQGFITYHFPFPSDATVTTDDGIDDHVFNSGDDGITG